ncbi:hypothetical protein GW750_08425 [bacterium]|nr:hypothetical protein [bacterium]
MSVEEKQHYVHLKKLLKKIAVIENIHLIETLKQLKALYPSESEELEQQRLASKD